MKRVEGKSIGEVVDILREEYPDIRASAIRFWEANGLLQPSRFKPGKHRRYSEDDLALIRFVKGLSQVGYSLERIKKELHSAKRKIGTPQQGQIPTEFFQSQYFGKIIQRQRMMNALNLKLRLIRGMLLEEIYQPLYDAKTLNRVLEYGIDTHMLDRAEELELIRPQEEEGKKMYSASDELILRILTLITHEEKNFLENCGSLKATAEYLSEKVGIRLRFPADPFKNPTISTYKAVLYNLLFEREVLWGGEKKNRGAEEGRI